MKLKIYTDGSYEHSVKTFGSGAVITDKDNNILFILKYARIDESGMRNVSGEIFAVTRSLDFLRKTLGMDNLKTISLEIYHDYDGVGFWPDNKWKANKPETQSYAVFVNSVRPYFENLEFISIKGHSGIELNEQADKTAKDAISECRGKDYYNDFISESGHKLIRQLTGLPCPVRPAEHEPDVIQICLKAKNITNNKKIVRLTQTYYQDVIVDASLSDEELEKKINAYIAECSEAGINVIMQGGKIKFRTIKDSADEEDMDTLDMID